LVKAGQGRNAIVLALRKQPNPDFPIECGFHPHFERVTVKVRHMVDQNSGPREIARVLKETDRIT
jgi:hypothetical protein